jgi:PAS domain S-box-containing protein
MDTHFFQEHSQKDPLEFKPQLLAELGKLQAKFVRGEDVMLPLCRVLAEQSGAQAVLLMDMESIDSEEMPGSAACWCRDPVRYLTLWKDVSEWPFHGQEPVVHQWHKFVVWPVKHTKILIFFHTVEERWPSFLFTYGDLLADILMGMFVQQTQVWQLVSNRSKEDDIEAGLFQSIVSNSEDLILVLRREPEGGNHIIFANAAATSITDYSGRQLINGKISQFFREGSGSAPEQEALLHALSTSNDFVGELWLTKASGEEALLYLHMVALEQYSARGRLFALVGRDITAQRQLQQAMARAQKMQAIGQLVGGVAHDFNNILGVLQGNLELMRLKLQDRHLDAYLNIAFKSCQRGTVLTRRLLQFSRQEQFKAENCQVNKLIWGLTELFSKSLTSQISLDTDLAPKLPLIRVDTGDLEDALLNLVLNARDAMNGEGRLIIKTGEADLTGFLPGAGGRIVVEEGHYVWISVRDSGSGIPLHLLDKIFEPFVSGKDKNKGTGLGLAMVYEFVNRSRGYISIVETGPRGTEFRLWFPALSGTVLSLPEVTADKTEYPKVKGAIKAVLVDDEPELLKVLADYCELLGIQTESFSDPQLVKDRYSRSQCDAQLLITDVLMPGGLNGYELASLLTQKHKLSVMLISGFIKDIPVGEEEAMPFKVLHKPFDLKGFIMALREVGVEFVRKADQKSSR